MNGTELNCGTPYGEKRETSRVPMIVLNGSLTTFHHYLATENAPGVKIGDVGLPVPWHYRAPRDTRTAFDMAGITDHSAWLRDRPGPLGIPHHALDDAICQARGVCDAYARLRDGDRQRFYNGWNARDIAAPSINAVGLSVHDAWKASQCRA